MQQTTHSIKFIFFISLVFSSLAPITSDLYLPSVPSMAVGLHASITMAQLTIAMFILGLCIARLIFGPLSDAFGRKNPIIIGSVICVIGGIICVFSTNIYVLIISFSHDRNQLPVGLLVFVAGFLCLLLWRKKKQTVASMKKIA